MSEPHRFEPQNYGPILAGLIGDPRLAELGPGTPERSVHVALRDFDPDRDLPQPIVNPDAARALQSGLWLNYDYLDESHSLSQEIDTVEGSFWHAIMHRREPDAFNSKYWWRRVSSHPVLDQLREQAPALGYDYTNPFDFVDFCEKCRGRNNADEELARKVQLLEWRLLFEHCYRLAVGS